MKRPEGFWKQRCTSLICRSAVALSLTVGFSLAAAPVASALEASPLDSHNSALNFASDITGVDLLSADELPPSFDLRDRGVVTPVKNQGVWSTCWGFAAVAAAETSLLSDLNTTYERTGLDLSERQLAYFSTTALPDGEEGDRLYNDQGGEGMHNVLLEDDDLPDDETMEDILGYQPQSAPLLYGGLSAYATSLYSSGIGPISESLAPYQNDEGILHPSGKMYAASGTWALDESLRLQTGAQLEESFMLPCPATFDEDGTYSYDERATRAIKEQLTEGRAVSIALCADQSHASDEPAADGFMNATTWANYGYEYAPANHAVTIVGWDDTYAAENFGTPDPETGEVDPSHRPPADGAWIVKNTWGAESSEFPNQASWGDDGYFYLSYYDQTLTMPEAFTFDAEHLGTDVLEPSYTNQYDYLPTCKQGAYSATERLSGANIFAAEAPQVIDRLSCETVKPNTTVTYQLYRLNEGATGPTDGELLVTLSDTYEYGGYHLIEIPESDHDKTRMATGERFSVVVTEYCNDDATYYVPLQAQVGKQQHDAQVASLYAQENETHALASKAAENISERYFDAHEGATDEDYQAWAQENAQAIQDEIDDYVTVQIEAMAPIYGQSVINRGESFVFDSEEVLDWNDAIADFLTEDELALWAFDNLPYKAYGTAVEPPFADIPADAWYFEAVEYAKEHGYMHGYDDTGLFDPEATVTREQAACVMYNWLGNGAKVEAADLDDVVQGTYYSDAVNWAVKNKIMNGYGNGTFGVGDSLTREQFACILANALSAEPGDVGAIEGMLGADRVSDWAESGVAWAVEHGVMNGVETEDGQRDLQPQARVSRAQIAAFVMNFLESGVA